MLDKKGYLISDIVNPTEVCKAAVEGGCHTFKFVNKYTLRKHPDLLLLSKEKWGN
jgi:hypothetical protein